MTILSSLSPTAIRLRLMACLAFSVVFISQCQSQFRPPQVEITNKDTVGYGFLQLESNDIENPAHLEPFFQKLYIQRTQGGQKINIVHLGDSHILGNFLTQEVRTRMQKNFGDAGRGLIFPYKLAGSNGPRDFLVESGCRYWRSSNCQQDLGESTTYGISGFCLETSNATCDLTFRLRDTATAETRLFTKVTLFYKKSPETPEVEISDDLTGQTAQLFLEDELSSSFYFDRPVGQFTLKQKRTDARQKSLALDGIELENELSGVLYHSIGVNGGKYFDFARAKNFATEVGKLSPDLIILSFGTNEAQGKMDPRTFYRQIDGLVKQLLEQSPNACLLFTTPADSYLRGKGFNPYLPVVSATIVQYAKEKGYACWDFFSLSGGEKSAQNWKSSGLMTSDSVHYTKFGYAAQGKLFYQSLMHGYNEFAQTRP